MESPPHRIGLTGAILAWIRDAPWLTPTRARAYAWIFAVLMGVGAVGWAAFSHGRLDPLGKLLGTDFASFWTASKLALQGRPEAVYDTATHAATQAALFDGAPPAYAAYFYPPIYLLYCLPLALVPYLVSLALWLAATGAACFAVLRRFLKPELPLIAFFAFPALLSNLGHGQNAFLTTALFGAAILSLPARPFAAGGFIGALAFKPHLGVVWPVALLASKRLKTFAAAGATVIALAALSYLVFGAATWGAFFKASALARATLEDELVGYEKMASVFAAARLIGAPVIFAYVVQGFAAIAACAALVWFLRKCPGSAAEGPAIVCASLLATPFLLDYDLMLLAIPLAWLAREGARSGFKSWEKSTLAAAFVLPIIARTAALAIGVHIAPLAIAALYAVILRRGVKAA